MSNKLDLTTLKNDPDFYKELIALEKNKSINKEKIFKKIGKKINQNIKFLIKNKNLQQLKENYEKNIIIFYR
jgi:hypothetical protein